MRARAITIVLSGAFFCASAAAQSALPRGIYSLSNAIDNTGTPQDDRLTGVRDYDFVAGCTLRLLWKDINPSAGVYNFNVIDQAIAQIAPLGQHLNLEVLNTQPQYTITGAANTWTDSRGQLNSVPWDTFTKSSYSTFVTALANHIVPDGQNKKLAEHPVLASVDAGVPGMPQGIRDINQLLVNTPTYTRQNILDAITADVAVSRNAFANKQGTLAMFSIDDGVGPQRLDTTLISQLAAQYNGQSQPTLAFFTENLSDAGPALAGALGTNYTAWRNDGGEAMFQALTSWVAPFLNPAAVASGNPATGIAHGYNTYGAKFFELYVTDLDAAVNGAVDAQNQPILPSLQSWNATLVPEPSAAIAATVSLLLIRRRRCCAFERTPAQHR